ncbi:NADPH:quinone reductase [Azospirillum sp. TSO22-1]|uniref:NADPH:quinone reductase n=1 Tax=Azospirillum sp. TSO22-1 TaxID=716789 RepID=UPI0018EEBFDD|nr:NADPH:quinone reductase [Azospirillum sp. TSO22-1]
MLIVGERPTPDPGAGEVRVRLHASGVNPSDVKSRRARPLVGSHVIPHSDGAGVIDAVGSDVPKARIGERVWTWNAQWGRPFGTAAEFVALPSAQAVRLPDGIDFDAGACLGIPALTAFQAVRLLAPTAGQTILMIGASSSVGHYVTQMAAQRGALVIGTVGSSEKAAHARTAGASETIDYKTEKVAERIKELTGGRGVDGIVDMDFSSTSRLLAAGVLAPHGTVVVYGSNEQGDIPVPFRELLFKSLTLRFFLVYDLLPDDRRAGLEGITALLEAGRLMHTVGARFPLDGIAAAHEAVEGGKVPGNTVVGVA